jgi:hypothetical protein
MIKIFFLAILAVSLCITGLYLVFTIWFRPKKKVMTDLGNYFPLVTILKPLKNMVDDLAENLESYFLLDYPNYEIIFGVDTMHDDTVPFIRSLQIRFPLVQPVIPTKKIRRSSNWLKLSRSAGGKCSGSLMPILVSALIH